MDSVTPFDVVKTRLQTQSDSPSSSSTRTKWPPQPSTSKAPYSYFAPSCESLMCRFDPRLSSAALPGGMSHCCKQLPLAYYHHHAAAVPAAMEHHHHPLSPGVSSMPRPNRTAATAGQFTGFWDAVVGITRNEGLSAMWRGTGPALAMSVPGQIIYMVGYDWGRQALFRHAPTWAFSNEPSSTGLPSKRLKSWYSTCVPLVSGVVSRSIVVAVISPIELIRTRSQASTSSTSLLSIVRGVNWSNAWTGLAPTLWRDVPFSGLYWVGYETIKRSLTGGAGMGERRQGTNARSEFAVAFVSGAGSGMIAATLTNPFDVVKTRRQANSPTTTTDGGPTKGTIRMLKEIARNEGWRGLMMGLTPRLAKIGPACAIMISAYEGLTGFLDE